MVQNISTNNNNSNNNKNDDDLSTNNKPQKCIPLPAPSSTNSTSSSSSSNGYGGNEIVTQSYAYGGNQSFVHSTNDVMQGVPVTSDYYHSNNDNNVAGSSSNRWTPGVVGLANIGNTCFMNSGLQCLINTPAISEYFLKQTFKIPPNNHNLALLTQFRNVVQQAWSGTKSKLLLHDFKNCLAVIHSQFKDSRQHDCQEFLALLLDSLHEQLKKWDEIQSKESNGDNWKGICNNDNNNNMDAKEEIGNNIVCRKDSNIVMTNGGELSDCDAKMIIEENKNKKNTQQQQLVPVNSTQVVTKSTVSDSSSVREPSQHSSSIDNSVKENLGNFEAKSKSRISNKTVVKGAEMSIFKLPNFTPAGSLCHSGIINDSINDNNLMSTTQLNNSTNNKSEKPWMTLKQQDRFDIGKFQIAKNRKKKFEDLDSPGSSKKKKLDILSSPCSLSPLIAEQHPQESKCGSINSLPVVEGDQHDTDLKGTIEMLPDSTHGDGISSSNLLKTSNGVYKMENDVNMDTSENDKCSDLQTKQDSSSKKDNEPVQPTTNLTETEEAVRATKFWNKHIQANDTVIAKTFQGLLKSTVICATCGYVSVTYEPFMYLSLPFPRILERKFAITFINMNSRSPPVKIDITVGIMDTTWQLKQKIAKSVLQDECEGINNLVLAEVYNYRVGRLIDNTVSVRKINDRRNLYVYALNKNFDDKYGPLSTPAVETSSYLSTTSGNSYGTSQVLYGPLNCTETAADSSTTATTTTKDDDQMTSKTYNLESWDDPKPQEEEQSIISQSCLGNSPKSNRQSPGRSSEEVVSSSNLKDDQDTGIPEFKLGQDQNMNCIICLEDCSIADMRQHIDCSCTICVHCLESSIKHHPSPPEATNTKLKCATCMKTVDGKDFIQYRPTGTNGSPKLTIELIPVVFRNDPNSDANNNNNGPGVFGYPWLLKIPSYMPAHDFYDFIASINPFPHVESKVLCVSEDGKSCGQCSRNSCRGCEFPRTGNVFIRPKSTIAISYTDLSLETLDSIQPKDMVEEKSFASWYRPSEPNYDIHDCLRAFSEIENLDEQNPWFCPRCAKNQCATKALSVCHFPDFLIVYLKRFVFMDHSSNKLNNKLKFPVNDLDLKEYIAPEFAGKEWNGLKDWKYDLYGCICHFGSISSGHYTAYGKNPISKEWHNFNDEIVSQQCPANNEDSSAYVLFYIRKGVQYDIPYKTNKIHPISELNTMPLHNRPSQPVSTIKVTEEVDEQWDTEPSVSSSSISNCSGFTGGTMMVQSVDEVSLSVGPSDSSTDVGNESSKYWTPSPPDTNNVKQQGEEECPSTSSQCVEEFTATPQSKMVNGADDETAVSSGYDADS